MWNMEAACFLRWRKSFALMALLERWQTSTAPSVLACGLCKWKGVVYTYYYTGIYPKSSLGFITYTRENSCTNIRRMALRVYSPCANTLALCVLRVNQNVDLSPPISTLRPPGVIHMISAPIPSHSSTFMYYANWRTKMGEAWKRG